MESRFAHDFSKIRVHADASAASAAQELGARAFTVQNDIHFGAGQYAPQTEAGRRLLAHELTHVLQQRAGGAASAGAEAHEGQANAASRGVIYTILPAAPTVQCQKNDGKPEPERKTDTLVTALKARLLFLVSQYARLQSAYAGTIMGQLETIPDAGQLHQSLAFAFLRHNPEVTIKSMDESAVGIDTTEIPKWKEKETLEEMSHGEYLATRPWNANLFITGPGTLWFTREEVQARADEYREFLWRSGGVPETELDQLMNPWYEQAADDLGKWITDFDREAPREAPFLIQFIADLNPLMAVANMISLFTEDKPLYKMHGYKATTTDWVEGWVGLVAATESILGELLADSVKGVKAAKAVKVGRAVANPIGTVSERMVKTWAKDPAVKKLLAELMAGAMNKTIWTGVNLLTEETKKPSKPR